MRKLNYSLLRVRKSFKNFSKNLSQYLLLISILTSNVGYPALAIAQEVADTTTKESIDIPVVETPVTDESEDILDEGISTSIFEEVPESSFENRVYTVNSVKLGEYIYPDNSLVKVNFTDLNEEGNLVISKVTLSQEQKVELNTTEDYAWDITSTMTNGTFKYDLTLPNNLGNDVEIKYSEDGNDYINAGEYTVNEESLTVVNLDHFTIFVVSGLTNVPTCDGASVTPPSGTTECYLTIQDAVDNATDGSIIYVSSGTYVLTSAINFDTPNISLIGIGNPVIQVSGIGYRFNITAPGVTIDGFKIEKTDKTGGQDIIYIGASNTTIQNNTISGQYVFGDSEVSRAMLFTGGLSGLLITNNTIYDLRQPGYISGPTTGTISNNNVYRTRGWVIEQGNMTFSGNTWGIGVDSNVYDIAIIPGVGPSYYPDIITMSALNNNAFIEDQRTTPWTLSIVYVDGTVIASGDGTARSPKKTLQEGIQRVAKKGTIFLKSNLDIPSEIDITKPLTLEGNGFTIFSKFTKTDNSNNAAIGVYADDVTIKNLTVDGTDGTDLHGIKAYMVDNLVLEDITAKNYRTGILVNGSTVLAKDITTSGNSWHGINVDQGSGVTTEAKLTIKNTSSHTEISQIFVDDTTKDVSVIDEDNQYYFVNYGNTRIYSLDNSAPTVPVLTFPINDQYLNANNLYIDWEESSDNKTSSSNIIYEYRLYSIDPTIHPSAGYFSMSYTGTTRHPSVGFASGTGEHEYWYTVRAIDEAENKSDFAPYRRFVVDNTPPIMVNYGISDNLLNALESSIDLTGDISDTLSPIESVKYAIWNSDKSHNYVNWTNTNALDGAYDSLNESTNQNIDITSLPEGDYVLGVRGWDMPGNKASGGDFYFTIDRTAPLTPSGSSFRQEDSSEIKSCNGWSNSHHGVIVNWNDNTEEDLDNYEYISYNSDGSTGPLREFTASEFDSSWWTVPQEGLYGFKIRAIDKAGNASDWTEVCGINIDWSEPTLSFEGIRYINSTTTDSLSTITNDNTPMILFKADDSLSGIDKTYVDTYMATYDGTYWIADITTPLSEGVDTLTLKAIDNAGNEKTITQEIFVDTNAPTATHTYLKDGNPTVDTTYVKDINQLSFTAQYFDGDPLLSSGILKDSYVIFDSNEAGTARTGTSYCGWRDPANTLEISDNPIITSVQFTNCEPSLLDGEYFMYHQVYDNATRKDIPSITQFRDVKGLHFIVDNTLPLMLDYNISDTLINASETSIDLTGDISDDLSPIESVMYKIENSDKTIVYVGWTNANASDGTYDSQNESTNQNIDITLLPEGDYILGVRGWDMAGNTRKGANLYFTIDRTAPVVEGISNIVLDEGDLLPTSEMVTATDNYELDKLCYSVTNTLLGTIINNECVMATANTTSWNINLAQVITDKVNEVLGQTVTIADTSLIPEGIYEFSYSVFDKAGNESVPQTFTVTINNVAPDVLFTTDNLAILAGENVDFTGSFIDPSYPSIATSDDSPWSHTFTSGDGYIVNGTSSIPGSLNFTHTYLAVGTYTAQLEVCESNTGDGEGQCTTETLTIVVSAIPQQQAAVLGANTGPTTTPARTTRTTGTYDTGIGGPDENLTEDELLAQTTDISDEDVKGAQTCESPKKISGYVYIDENDNQKKDEDEKTFGNIKLTIYTENGEEKTTIKEVTTDENGYWETEICAGQYKISVDKTNLPKNFDTEFGDVLSVSIPENADSIEANILINDNRNFWQKNWPWIILVLAGVGVTSLLLLDKKRED